jgi:two-component system NtrC family sensor kinase
MNTFSLRNLSLRYVLVLALLVGLLLPSWLAYQIEIGVAQKHLSAELAQDRDRYVDMLAVSLSEPLWQFEPLFAAPMIGKIMEDPQVTSVRVVRIPGQDVFIERRKPDSVVDSSANRSIERNGTPLGVVYVAVNSTAVQAATQDARRRFLLRTAGICAAAIALIFLALHWRLTRPIDQLVRQSEALASGQLQTVLEWRRDDELGRVGHSLEKTRQSLNTLVEELRNANTELRAENLQRKAAEADLVRYAQDLEQRVAERTVELSDANASLSTTLQDLQQTQSDLVESKKQAALGRMVAGLAHELNTPIGTALTIGTTIGERVRDLRNKSDTGQLKRSSLTEFLESAQEASEVLERLLRRAAGLVESFKKVAARDTAAVLELFELAELVALVNSEDSSNMKDSAIALAVRIPPHIFMTSYPEPLRQVLAMLLDNARKHAFEGHTNPRIDLMATVADGKVVIAISDNGVGIPDDLHQRIFEPMFTVHMGRGGLGLGLGIAQGLVTRQLGGTLTVQNNTSAGVRFVITLPLMVAEALG